MERLTDPLSTKCSMSPWDWCGLDSVCKRDCFKPEPCKIPKMLRRLAQYEDAEEEGRMVEVIRCGECSKQFMPDCPMQIIEKHQQIFICQNDNDYCSFGESKAEQAKGVSE